MAWIESHQSLARHPKTLRLMRRLGTSRAETIGHLHLFWWWCLDYAPDGELTQFDNEEIAIAAEWEGDADTFSTAMIDAGFIDVDYALRFVHDWEEYGGKLLARKESNKNRMRETRAANKSSTETHDSSGNNERATHVQRTDDARAANVQSQRRVEESRGENRRVEESVNAPAQAKPKTPRKDPETFVPESFPLEQRHYDYGATKGLNRAEVDDETEAFLLWHGANQTKYGNWYMAWQLWIRNAVKRKGNLTPMKGGRANVETFNGNPVFDHRGNPTTAYFLRQVEQLEAEERKEHGLA